MKLCCYCLYQKMKYRSYSSCHVLINWKKQGYYFSNYLYMNSDHFSACRRLNNSIGKISITIYNTRKNFLKIFYNCTQVLQYL